MMVYDFNILERAAKKLMEQLRFRDAIAIYLFMASGNSSLDAGYLGMKLGECYEKAGDLHAAKYWYGRAVEENPAIDAYVVARRRLDQISIDLLLQGEILNR